jgi:hypothetical protein
MKIHKFAILCVIVILICGCNNETEGNSPAEIQRIYNELKAIRNAKKNVHLASRSVINMENISTSYNWAILDKFIDGYTAYPDHHSLDSRDWTDVAEGIIKLDYYGPNGDGTEMWIFITIQDENHYVIFAGNDDNAKPFSEMEIGIVEDSTNPGQKWFYKWQ